MPDTAGSASTTATAAAAAVQTLFFPSKLLNWTADPHVQHIQWICVDEKMCLYINDKIEFAAECYNGNYENFRRQLSEYGFKKVHLFKGHKENYNRAVYHREGFSPDADVSSLRKEIMKAKKQSKTKPASIGNNPQSQSQTTPQEENDQLEDYIPELTLPTFASLLRKTEFESCVEQHTCA
jgi:hypothetical protein